MHAYAAAQGIEPHRNLSQEVIESVKENSKTNTTNSNTDSKSWMSSLGALFLSSLIAISSLYYFMSMKGNYETLEKKYIVLQEKCDSLSTSLSTRIDRYDQIYSNRSTPIFFAATDNYSDTKLIFHNNPLDQINYIQVSNLPPLQSGQSFQLWSLKEGVDPIPLTVFSLEDGALIPVDYEEGTATYAITIEKSGGVSSPTLSRLIATVGV